MEKNSYAMKDIIMGLRDDFRIRNNILLEMRKRLYPIDPKIDINLFFDEYNQSVDLEAHYIKDNLVNALKYFFSRKYIFDASFYKEKDGTFIFSENDPKRIFPVELFDIVDYQYLKDKFTDLLESSYDITNDSDIFVYYNSLVFISQKLSELYNVSSIDYNPRGDIITIANKDSRYTNLEEIINERFDRDKFTNIAQIKIDNYLKDHKPISIIDDYNDNSDEQVYGIRNNEKRLLIVRKNVK